MTLLADLYHWWNSDLVSTNSGDLQTVDGSVRGQQRIVRRLMTNPGGYLWHPEYGGGLASYLGSPIDVGKVTAAIRAQLLLEDAVDQSVPPVIVLTQSANDLTAFNVSISYNDATTQKPVVLAFNVSN